MRRSTWFRSGSLGLALGGALLACQILAGIEEVPKVEPPVGSPDGSPARSEPCARQDVPAPTGRDDVDASLPTIKLGLRRLEFVIDRDDRSPIGLDLDGVCTCETRPNSAFAGAPSCIGRDRTCDFDGGVDNQLRSVFKPIEDPLVETGTNVEDALNVNDQIATGRQTVLFDIAGWNGTPNDASVTLFIYLSNGIKNPNGCPDAAPSNDIAARNLPDAAGTAWTWRPQWCGEDIWTYDPTTTGGDGFPLTFLSGYVTNGKLVVSTNQSVALTFGGSTLEVTAPRIVADLVRTEGGTTLVNGLFAGRIAADAFLEGVGRVTSIGNDGKVMALCNDKNDKWHPTFLRVRDLVCGSRDIRANASDDNQGLPCDAISVAFRVSAESVQVKEALQLERKSLEELGCGATKDAGKLACPPATAP